MFLFRNHIGRLKKFLFLLGRHNSIVLIIVAILLSFLVGNHISLPIKSFIYSISLLMKEILEFFIPIIIFAYTVDGLVSIKTNGLFVIIVIVLTIISSFIATIVSFALGAYLTHGLTVKMVVIATQNEELLPMFNIHLPSVVTPGFMLIVGVFVALWINITKKKKLIYATQLLKKYISFFLCQLFVPLLPIFILGFGLKLEYDGVMANIFRTSFTIIINTIGLLLVYMTTMYIVASGFNLKQAFRMIRRSLPAGLVGLLSISSMAALPATLAATEKNTKGSLFAKMSIILTVNIHWIGECLAFVILVFYIMKMNSINIPTFSLFLPFALQFCIYRFAVAAIPLGGIIVMYPLLHSYFGFTPEMNIMITTFFILLDPLFTCTNIMCNGAFAIMLHRLVNKLNKSVSQDKKEISLVQ